MSKQVQAPLLIQLHDDGAHLHHDGHDHGVVSPDCLDLLLSHRRAVREMLDAMKAADHTGEPTPDEQKRLDEADEAEMLGALRLAHHRLINDSRADKIAVELHAAEFAPRSEFLDNLIPIPDSLVISLAETVMADPSRAMAGRGSRSVSDFATIEAKISAFQAWDKACEASWAAQDSADSEASAKEAEAETDRCFKRLAEAANVIRDHRCATSAEATALLVFAAGSPAFQREIFEQGDESQTFLKSLIHFAAPTPEADDTATDTKDDAGNVWDLINAHKAAYARVVQLADALKSGRDEDAAAFLVAVRAEEVAAVEVMAAMWEGGQYVRDEINDYLRTAEANAESGMIEQIGEMSREPIMALRDHYRASPTTSAE